MQIFLKIDARKVKILSKFINYGLPKLFGKVVTLAT